MQKTNKKISKDEKQEELLKYRSLIFAAIDYYLEINSVKTDTLGFDSAEYYKEMKKQADVDFQKGRLSKLKQWFRDLTEMPIETVDFKFNEYLKKKTKYDIDIFEKFYHRIEMIIKKGKITTDYQFEDINIMVDQLSQAEPINKEKIDVLNKLLIDYEQNMRMKNRTI